MCEESLSSLFFCLQLRSAGNRSTFGATGSERETRPKGFDERINVYPLVGFFEEKPTGKHLSPLLVVYKKITIS